MQTKKMTKSDWEKIKSLVHNKSIDFDDSTIADFVKKIA
jgi:hypothetical protein